MSSTRTSHSAYSTTPRYSYSPVRETSRGRYGYSPMPESPRYLRGYSPSPRSSFSGGISSSPTVHAVRTRIAFSPAPDFGDNFKDFYLPMKRYSKYPDLQHKNLTEQRPRWAPSTATENSTRARSVDAYSRTDSGSSRNYGSDSWRFKNLDHHTSSYIQHTTVSRQQSEERRVGCDYKSCQVPPTGWRKSYGKYRY